MANGLFAWLEPASDSDVIGKAEWSAVPGVAGIIGILPVAMDCEESAFAGIDCEGVKPAKAGAEGFTV